MSLKSFNFKLDFNIYSDNIYIIFTKLILFNAIPGRFKMIYIMGNMQYFFKLFMLFLESIKLMHLYGLFNFLYDFSNNIYILV